MTGAIQAVCGQQHMPESLYGEIVDTLSLYYMGYVTYEDDDGLTDPEQDIIDFNDEYNRRKQDVLDVLTKTIERVRDGCTA